MFVSTNAETSHVFHCMFVLLRCSIVRSHTRASLLYSMKSVTLYVPVVCHTFVSGTHACHQSTSNLSYEECDTCPVVLFCAVGRADCVELADSDKDRPDGGWEED